MTSGNTLIDGINQGHGTLGKLAKDEQFYDRMNSTMAHVGIWHRPKVRER